MREYTAKQIKELKVNPYTLKVTKNKLYFTIKFKEDFWTSYQAGNAHIGFNEPGEAFELETHCVHPAPAAAQPGPAPRQARRQCRRCSAPQRKSPRRRRLPPGRQTARSHTLHWAVSDCRKGVSSSR